MENWQISDFAFEILQKLSKEDREKLKTFLEDLKPGLNKMNEIAGEIYEISKRDKISVVKILNKIENYVFSSKMNRREKIEEARHFLKKLRYPFFTAKVEQLLEKIKELKLPPNIKINYPQNLEKKELEIKIKAKNFSDFKKALDLLKQKVPLVDEIFKVL